MFLKGVSGLFMGARSLPMSGDRRVTLDDSIREALFLVASRPGVRDTTGPTSSSAASTITTGSSSIAYTFFIFFSRAVPRGGGQRVEVPQGEKPSELACALAIVPS
jgi:hypothetical protein